MLSNLLGRRFECQNPFTWLTKTEVVSRIAARGCGDLIRDTRSCTRVHAMTKLHPHCGQCSQCIDRRFAILGAGQDHEDPAEAYNVDLFLGSRLAGPDREMALAFVRTASIVSQMEDVTFFANYGEASRVVGFFRESADTVATQILDLHRRHASAVCHVFDATIASNAASIRDGSLPMDCLLSLVIGDRGGGLTYSLQTQAPDNPIAVSSEIKIAIDETETRVVMDRWGELKGASAELIIALSRPFRQAARDELVPEHYPFTRVSNLLALTTCTDDETFRRRVHRCRGKIAQIAKSAGDPPPSIDAVIENIEWRGYRLNPDRIRIVTISELRDTHCLRSEASRRKGHAFSRKGHASRSQPR